MYDEIVVFKSVDNRIYNLVKDLFTDVDFDQKDSYVSIDPDFGIPRNRLTRYNAKKIKIQYSTYFATILNGERYYVVDCPLLNLIYARTISNKIFNRRTGYDQLIRKIRFLCQCSYSKRDSMFGCDTTFQPNHIKQLAAASKSVLRGKYVS